MPGDDCTARSGSDLRVAVHPARRSRDDGSGQGADRRCCVTPGGAPYLDWIASRPRLTGAIQGIIAAIVGVIADLSAWLTLNVWFGAVERGAFGPWTPDFSTINFAAIIVSALAAALLLLRKLDLLLVLALMSVAGIGVSYAAVGI